jgi:hypothetical protein
MAPSRLERDENHFCIPITLAVFPDIYCSTKPKAISFGFFFFNERGWFHISLEQKFGKIFGFYSIPQIKMWARLDPHETCPDGT